MIRDRLVWRDDAIKNATRRGIRMHWWRSPVTKTYGTVKNNHSILLATEPIWCLGKALVNFCVRNSESVALLTSAIRDGDV